MNVSSAVIHVSRGLQRGQNPPFINNHPASIIDHPLILRILLIPPQLHGISVFL